MFYVVVLTLFPKASAFRVNVLNFAYEVFDTNTTITLSGEHEELNIIVNIATLEWVPDGYTLISFNDDGYRRYSYDYENEKEERISFHAISGSGNMSIDTEDADVVENIIVNGFEGLYVLKEGRQALIWGDTEQDLIYDLFADNISKDDFYKILDNIVW